MRRGGRNRGFAWECHHEIFPIPREMSPEAALSLDDIREIAAFIREQRTDDAPFDIAVGGETPGDDRRRAVEIAAQHAEAGATGWQESIHGLRQDLAGRAEATSWINAMRWRIEQGPPAL